MHVSVETTQGLERRMTVSVPSDRIESEVTARLKNLSRTARLKGFRPGKVPLKVLESRYGLRVRADVVSEVTRSTFFEALAQEKLQLASMPRFEQRIAEPGKNLEYEAVFEVMGGVQVAPVDGFEIKRPKAEITAADIDRMIETLRRQRASWHAVSRSAAAGDQVLIDFEGTVDGAPFDGNQGTNFPLVLGSHTLIAGFEDGLIGTSAGDERTLDLVFPARYHAAHLAGRPVQFKVKVHAVMEAQLPALDEAFVRGFDVPDGQIESLRNEVSKTMNEELTEAIYDVVRQQVMDQLYGANPIEIPRAQVDQEIDIAISRARESMQGRGLPVDESRFVRSEFEPGARRNATLRILVREIVKENGFIAEPEKVRARVESIAASYEDPEEAIRWYYADRARLANIESLVLEDHVVDWVLSRAKVSDYETSFEELMNDRRGA